VTEQRNDAGLRVVLIGAPGSGKGTQAVRLAARFGVAHIAAGDRLRAEVASGSALGAQLAGYLARGDLVPDEVVLDILWPQVVAAAEGGGYVIDGFPRTLRQAEAAYERARTAGVAAHAAVHLAGEPDELVRRMLARAATQGRVDDVGPVIRHRMEVYDAETRPVLDHYAARGVLVTVDALQPVDDVFAAILAGLGALPSRD
jgi:adenylate kinase